MTSSNSSNLVNITKNPYYSRQTRFFCVISNSQYDFVCHELFVKSASEYFRNLLTYQKEDYEIEPGHTVPRLVSAISLYTYEPFKKLTIFTRIHVRFTTKQIKEFFRFAYYNVMKITLENVEEVLKFSSFVNSMEMLALVEKFLCEMVASLPERAEQLKEYFQLADFYMLEQFKHELISRTVVGSSFY